MTPDLQHEPPDCKCKPPMLRQTSDSAPIRVTVLYLFHGPLPDVSRQAQCFLACHNVSQNPFCSCLLPTDLMSFPSNPSTIKHWDCNSGRWMCDREQSQHCCSLVHHFTDRLVLIVDCGHLSTLFLCQLRTSTFSLEGNTAQLSLWQI